ncbi:tRNA pseudouridine(38-40) synthase TruA [Rhizobiaceae bacterium]|nr:tRNA pseudouridine(38-40) synthase TruA [Rhizobiaceae bacterium]
MSRYRLDIEYDGTPFSGWQRQRDRPSVQGAIEQALEKLGEPEPQVQGAGRTDAGVHALGQVAHVDCVRPWAPFRLMEALNAHLRQGEHPVAINDCGNVDDDFHARFSATARAYLYRIAPRRAPLALDERRAWQVKVPLDVAAMNEAAQRLLGTHDFTTFRSTECQAKSPVKTLDVLRVHTFERHGATTIEIEAGARSFLHNQVRSISGSLVQVGTGKWTADDLSAALEARDRSACAALAPPHGLYLVSVAY